MNDINYINRIRYIHSEFKKYRGVVNNVWEEYCYLKFAIKTLKTNNFDIIGIFDNINHKKTKEDAGGMQSRFLKGENAKKHFLEVIGKYEKYVIRLMTIVYNDYPAKMNSLSMDCEKIFKLILNSNSKNDIIKILVEEKLRNIFYGNPLDIFAKDKLRVGFDEIYLNKCGVSLKLYKEMIAKRNVIIHNDSRVDNKFIKEVDNNRYKINQHIHITEDYLRGSIAILLGLSAILTECTLKNIYKCERIQGKLKQVFDSFNNAIGNDWLNELMF